MPQPLPVPGSPFTTVLRGRRPFGWVAGQKIFGNFPAWPDIGPVALFLASEGSGFINGNTLFADGGSYINGVTWRPAVEG